MPHANSLPRRRRNAIAGPLLTMATWFALAGSGRHAGEQLACAEEAAPNAASVEGLHDLPIVEEYDLTYYEGADADPRMHKLDLFYPAERKNFPTVVFVHGGAWMIGDKSDFGIYAAIGRMLARHGIAMANINYRLSPGVKHPEHIKDVARAFAWVHQHIGEHGGDPALLFVSGHSAGGHLSALLATDETWLKGEGLSLANVKGAIPISGAYHIGPGFMFRNVFGADPEERRLSGALAHVKAGCPPFLIMYASDDFPTCDRNSEAFAAKLKECGITATTMNVIPRNHLDIIGKTARNDDPCALAMRSFVWKHAHP